MGKKVYLVYDYEEFCGAFSSLQSAKKAVEEHLEIIRESASAQAKKLNMGDLEYELSEDKGENAWVYSFLVKSRLRGHDIHCRRPTIYKCPLDRYDSVTKRLAAIRKK